MPDRFQRLFSAGSSEPPTVRDIRFCCERPLVASVFEPWMADSPGPQSFLNRFFGSGAASTGRVMEG